MYTTTACPNTSGQEPTHACSGYWDGMRKVLMGKPYTIVQRDKYKLTIYRGTTPLNSDCFDESLKEFPI